MVCAERAHAAGILRRDQQGSFCIFCPVNKRNTALAIEVLLHCYHHWFIDIICTYFIPQQWRQGTYYILQAVVSWW